MLLGGSVSPWRSGVEEGRSPLGRFRKPEPCFPRTYATWDAKKDENRFESMKFRLITRLGISAVILQPLPQHFLYFLPLPQGQGSLRPIFGWPGAGCGATELAGAGGSASNGRSEED